MSEKETRYKDLVDAVESVLSGTQDLISSMASIACLVKQEFDDLIWSGFYILAGDELHVGPYQGSLGCTTIKIGAGVCGRCAEINETIVVPDVHRFDGHIACDGRANSEIALPVHNGWGDLIAVLDLDSARFDRFDETDKMYLEKIVKLLATKRIFF